MVVKKCMWIRKSFSIIKLLILRWNCKSITKTSQLIKIEK